MSNLRDEYKKYSWKKDGVNQFVINENVYISSGRGHGKSITTLKQYEELLERIGEDNLK